MDKNHKDIIDITTQEREEKIKKLRAELSAAMDNIDEFSMERIDQLSAALEELEPKANEFDLESAKEEFFRDYYPSAVKMRNESEKPQVGLKRRVKLAAVVAAALLCLCGGTVAIAGINIFETIFKSNSEILRINVGGFGKTKESIKSQNGITWEELEIELGEEIPIIRYFVEKMDIGQMQMLYENMAVIEFLDGDNVYTYTVQELEAASVERVIEKTEKDVQVITLDDIEYHIVQNRKWMTIIWQKDNLLCTVAGNFDKDEAINAIESIEYKEE